MRIAITSSLRPSTLVRRFINRLAGVLPADRVNRGSYALEELAALLFKQGYTHLIVVDRKHGNPSRLRLFKIKDEFRPFGYLTITGVRRLKPWTGPVEYVRVKVTSEATKLLNEFLEELPHKGRIGTVVEDNNGRIIFRLYGKPYGVQLSWSKAYWEPKERG